MDTGYDVPERSMRTTVTTWQDCPSCGEEREFEQPPCGDGHGDDCPERSCVSCGHALVAEFDLEVEVRTAPDTVETRRGQAA